ncbi:FAGR275Cp [Eremothecium gossypii FDAG1]|nr:FAGR275Cp [Eremothecium gossypii FDAG1]
MEVGANGIFLHQNDSAETIKLEMSPVGGSGSAGSGSAMGSADDELTKCISDLNIFDLLHNNPPSSSDDNEEGGRRAAASGPWGTGARARPALRKLKSSLKLAASASSCSSASLSSSKSVRFAPQLATVKRFDLNSEPMSISNENSPELTSLDQLVHSEGVLDKFWFGTQPYARVRGLRAPARGVPKFTLDYDSDDSDDKELDGPEFDDLSSIELSEEEGYDDDDDEPARDEGDAAGFLIRHWELGGSNLVSFHPQGALPLQDQLFQFLQGHNIRLNKVSLVDMHTIKGSLYVTNLHFEKFIEVKFSFDEWKNIHYVTAQYLKTVTSKVDEFQFIIDLSSYKYFMKVKNLLYCVPGARETWCPVTMSLCCRYDVNGETYYDNNNYENYQFNAKCLTVPAVLSTVPSRSALLPDQPSRVRKRSGRSIGGNYAKTSCYGTPPHSKSYSNVPLRKSLSYDFLMNFSQKKANSISSSSSSSPSGIATTPPLERPPISRKFPDDTDYFNTSPLKHIYHFNSIKNTTMDSAISQKLTNGDAMHTDSSRDYVHGSLSSTASNESILRTPRLRDSVLSSSISATSNSSNISSEDRSEHRLYKTHRLHGHAYGENNSCSSSGEMQLPMEHTPAGYAKIFGDYNVYSSGLIRSREPGAQNINSFLAKTICSSHQSATKDSDKVAVFAEDR